MARGAQITTLRRGHGLRADDLQICGFPVPGGDTRTHVAGGRAMAGFAVDTRLLPGGVIRLRDRIVVPGELAYVATVTGGVEGVRRLGPMNSFVCHVWKVA